MEVSHPAEMISMGGGYIAGTATKLEETLTAHPRYDTFRVHPR